MKVLRTSYRLLFYFILITLTGFAGKADNPDAVLGVWLSPKKKNQVQIYRRGNKYYGKLVWMIEPHDPSTQKPKIDHKNPEGRLRSRPLLNMDIMSDFTYAGNNLWQDGQIYNPEDGKTYSCELSLKDYNTLQVRGYMLGMPMLGKTVSWTRVK